MTHEPHETPANTSEKASQPSIEEIASLTHPEITKAGAFMVMFLTSYENIDKESLQKAWSKYAQATEAFVDSIEEPNLRTKAQIAAIINKAFIFQHTGNTQRYLEELDSAEVYAANEGLTDISDTLTTEIHDHLEHLGETPEALVLRLKGVIEDSDREYLRELIDEGDDFEDVLNAAYGIILQGGNDPDEVLTSIGVTQ